nr:glycosyltransferase [Gulosibacter molinativorax]
MDDFSLSAWSHEFETVELTPKWWRQQIEKTPIDLLFVESAWHGNHGQWDFKLTGSNAPSPELRALVSYCNVQKIPTVFWNKEDPPHFDDFLDTARLFDAVFTSDANTLPEYREELEHDRIGVMSFAAAPAIHNPIRIPSVHQKRDVAFAGMYFAHKFPERRAQMDMLLGAANDVSGRMNKGLEIYSRFEGGDARYQFPKPLNKRVRGGLTYQKMLTAYRLHKVFLNVNSVTDSPSMCARRVFEITASGTPVVSAPSVAIPQFFPQDEVPVVDGKQEAGWLLRALVNSPHMRDRMVHKAQRRIWGNHTYAHRATQVLKAAGIEFPKDAVDPKPVTVMVSTNRPYQVDHVLRTVADQVGVPVQLAMLTHNFSINAREFKSKARDLGLENVILTSATNDVTLGGCLNRLVQMSDGEIIAKFDDDDYYGKYYLLDSSNALRFTNADLIGKQAVYVYLAAQDAMVLRSSEREHRWTTFLAGPTFVGPASTYRAIPFPQATRGEDSQFLKDLTNRGGRAYSSDRFNFIQQRGKQAHTWQVNDLEVLANSRVESYGINRQHSFV